MNGSRGVVFSPRVVFILVLLWGFATAANITKPYHIDDTVHLETALWIQGHPLSPMDGAINWSQSRGLIHELNNPHLFFYLLAGWMAIWGSSEIATHILLSLFVLLCVFTIYRIAYKVAQDSSLFITAVVVLSPSFVISQNLMIDLPLLALWCLFYYFLLDNPSCRLRRYLGAAIFAGLSCLIKYTSVTLITVLLLVILIDRKYKLLWVPLVPIFVLSLWSIFNFLDYGGIHILGRESGVISVKRSIRLLVHGLICLGAMFPYIFVLFFNSIPRLRRSSRLFVITGSLALTSALLVHTFVKKPAEQDNIVLLCAFSFSGIFMLFSILCRFSEDIKELIAGRSKESMILYIWIASASAFTVMFAPFMAVRHVLLIILPVVVFLLRAYPISRNRIAKIGILLTSVLLTILIGISDYKWATYLKIAAQDIASNYGTERHTFFAGHWGWQWYAAQSGMIQLDATQPQCEAGDIIVVPREIDQQDLTRITEHYSLHLLSTYSVPVDLGSLVKTDRGRFYSSSVQLLPWTVNTRRFGAIDIYQVVPL